MMPEQKPVQSGFTFVSKERTRFYKSPQAMADYLDILRKEREDRGEDIENLKYADEIE